MGEGKCSENSIGVLLLRKSVESIFDCQVLCIGKCRYVSYAREGGKYCYGVIDDCKILETDQNLGWKYVTYTKKYGNIKLAIRGQGCIRYLMDRGEKRCERLHIA